MNAYQTLVVGTDGSDTSMRAVDHAAAVAADNDAKLVIAMAHLPTDDKGGWGRPGRPDRVIAPDAEVLLGGEGDYKVHGEAPVYEILREARDRYGRRGRRTSRCDRFWAIRYTRCPASPRRLTRICLWSAM